MEGEEDERGREGSRRWMLHSSNELGELSQYLCHWVRFFQSLTRSDQLWSFPSRFSTVSRTKVSHFLIVPEQPVSIQNRSGSIVRKPGVAGEMSGVSQSDVLFTIDGFQALW